MLQIDSTYQTLTTPVTILDKLTFWGNYSVQFQGTGTKVIAHEYDIITGTVKDTSIPNIGIGYCYDDTRGVSNAYLDWYLMVTNPNIEHIDSRWLHYEKFKRWYDLRMRTQMVKNNLIMKCEGNVYKPSMCKLIPIGDDTTRKFVPTVCNAGYIGVGNYKSTNEKGRHTENYKIWSSLIRNAHCQLAVKTTPYQLIPEWLNFQVFAEWYENHSAPNLFMFAPINEKGVRYYSPETVTFEKRNVLSNYAPNLNIDYEVCKNGVSKAVNIKDLSEFCTQHQLDKFTLFKTITGQLDSYKGFKLAGVKL